MLSKTPALTLFPRNRTKNTGEKFHVRPLENYNFHCADFHATQNQLKKFLWTLSEPNPPPPQHSTHASQVTICSHITDNVLYSLYVSTFNQVCNF